jgi:hypothetical protein
MINKRRRIERPCNTCGTWSKKLKDSMRERSCITHHDGEVPLMAALNAVEICVAYILSTLTTGNVLRTIDERMLRPISYGVNFAAESFGTFKALPSQTAHYWWSRL